MMKKIIIILLLIITVGVTLAVTHVYAQNNADNAAQPKEKIKIENPIKEVEILDYEVTSKIYEFSTMERRSELFKLLHKITGIISFVLLTTIIVLGLLVSKKPGIKNIYIITAVILFVIAAAHLFLDLL